MEKIGVIMEESFDKIVMECNNCHLTFHAHELKVDPINDFLVCVNCFSNPGSKIMALDRRSYLKKKMTNVPERGIAPQEMTPTGINSSMSRPARIRIRNAP